MCFNCRWLSVFEGLNVLVRIWRGFVLKQLSPSLFFALNVLYATVFLHWSYFRTEYIWFSFPVAVLESELETLPVIKLVKICECVCHDWNLQDQSFVVRRWSGFAFFRGIWSPTCITWLCSCMWQRWDEYQHYQNWGNSLSKNPD